MADVIRLHAVAPGQGLPASAVDQAARRRLKLFAGRSLGEAELGTMQAYADYRLEESLERRQPGVVHGLELAVAPVGGESELHVTPGLAVGADGRAIRLSSPLAEAWSSLADDFKDRMTRLDAPVTELHGLYFVTLRREVEHVDRSGPTEPETRTELDPLRDERLETIATLSLAPVELGDEVVLRAIASQTATVNHALAALVETDPFDHETGAIPLGMVAVKQDALLWLDPLGGRFVAADAPVYRSLVAHTQAALERAVLGGPAAELVLRIDALGLSYLPSAGQLPRALVSGVASATPAVEWLPKRLYLELVPAAESAIDALLHAEYTRGLVELNANTVERLRIVLGLPDVDYRPDLLDLPEADHRSENDLYRQGALAHAAWSAWHRAYDDLFSGLTAVELAELVPPVADPAPVLPAAFFDKTLKGRAWEVRSAGAELGAPYQEAVPPAPEGYELPAPEPLPTQHLLRDMLVLRRRIAFLQGFLSDLDHLLNDFDDSVALQRQHIDALTVSFTRLAGGIPGDGSGLQVAKLLPAMELTTKKVG